jgi:hypothetical protein
MAVIQIVREVNVEAVRSLAIQEETIINDLEGRIVNSEITRIKISEIIVNSQGLFEIKGSRSRDDDVKVSLSIYL